MQLREAPADVFQPALNLSALASYEQVDAIMLGFEDVVEGIAEGFLGRVALPGNRYCFSGALGGLVLDEVFQVIIVDVDCKEKVDLAGA